MGPEIRRGKARILSAIGDKIVAVEHHGSTAVPGLSAKPTIDILIALRHLDDSSEIGYEYRPLEETLTLGTR